MKIATKDIIPYKYIAALLFCIRITGFGNNKLSAQGLHFSQYYNAPMLLNPANTGLMAENDYRAGLNYRTQWASVPVPYSTFSAYTDYQIFRNRNQTNWLGVGLAFFNDVAGDGNLALSRYEAFAAYHLEMGSSTMLSVGLSGAYNQRSIDFEKLTFDTQWDGFSFDGGLPNGEKGALQKTSYLDVSAGANFAYFPNENVYLKVGAGLAHFNQPTESFYGMSNKIGIRPTGNIDAVLVANPGFTINPSAYYTTQKGAYELLYGSLFIFSLSGHDRMDHLAGQRLILGLFHRWDEAIVGAFGMEWNGLRVMMSYDYTISQLGTYNGHNGALEFGVVWQGNYHSSDGAHKTFNCPRFF